VLFTAATAMAGTSMVARKLSETLVAVSGKRVSLVDTARMERTRSAPNLERALIEKLKKDFDYVVIDAPPVLEAPEIGLWIEPSDAMYFVIPSEEVRKPVVDKALEAVRRFSVPVLGVVLNKRKYPIPERIYRFLYR